MASIPNPLRPDDSHGPWVSAPTTMNQGIFVFIDDGTYRAITRMTRDTIASSSDAAEVIQKALDLAGEQGGQVFVEQGAYPLARPVHLHHRVRLTGTGRSTRLLVSGEAGVILKNLDSAEVGDLAIVAENGSGAKAGLIIDGCGDCQATHVLVGGFVDYGIWLCNHSFLCTIRGCSAASNGQANIYLDTLAMSGRAGRYLPNLVADSMIYGGEKGIDVRRAAVANIVGCCAFQTRGNGFHVRAGSNSVVISGCRTFQVSKHAVVVEDSDEINLTGNIFCWHVEDGVILRNAHWGTISGNEIIDSGSYNSGVEDRTATWDQLPKDLPPYCGLRLLAVRGCTVSGNNVFNWGVCPPMEYGIFEDDQSYKNNFTGNSINFFVKKGLLSLGRDSQSANNLNHAERPHQDRPGLQHWFQTFRTDLKDKFVVDQLARDVPCREPDLRSFEDQFLRELPRA